MFDALTSECFVYKLNRYEIGCLKRGRINHLRAFVTVLENSEVSRRNEKMLENNRDEINYHKFLKSARKAQHISLEKTGFGICTKSEMSRIEAGSRLPDKIVRDRLAARLGVSGEEYEEYLQPREFEQWELRMDIIRCINKKDIEGAERHWESYEKRYAGNRVERQFVEAMLFLIYELKGYSDEELCKQIHKALVCTVPDMNIAFVGAQLLADQELNLIMEYVRLHREKVPGITEPEWKLKKYQNVIQYVEDSRMDKIAQAKIYSKVACLVSEVVLSDYLNEKSVRFALELCTQAIELLRVAFRLYYFVELNEYSMKLIDKLCEYTDEKKELADLNEIKTTRKAWAELFIDLYTEHGLPVYMQNFTYLYVETQCNNFTDVIRKRRAMMGLPRRKFIGLACDERTLLRIEVEGGNPSMSIMRDLLERVGICAEYKRARIVSSNPETLGLVASLYIRINEENYEEAIVLYDDLCKKIDMEIPHNEQAMKRVESLILGKRGEISAEEHRDLLIDMLECTLSVDALMSNSEKYLSEMEYFCVQDLALYTEGEVQKFCRGYLENICAEILKMEEVDSSQFCIYECAMTKSSHYMGNEGRYDESLEISNKLLKESLRNRRMVYLVSSEYNKLWCSQKISELHHLTIDKNLEIKLLNRGLLLSDLANYPKWKRFFQQKLDI